MESRQSARFALNVPDQDGIAKYLSLRNALAHAVASGKWKAGERMPSDDEIVSATRMSLGTVQRAMRMLVDDRIVVRRQGSGTFVASDEAPMNAPLLHCRFLDPTTDQALPIFSRVLRRRAERSSGRWSSLFAREDIMCIERVFSINKEFDVFTHLYFERDRFPALASEMALEALTGVNFKDLLSRDYQLTLQRFSETLSVKVFPDKICRTIDIPLKTSGAVLDIVAYDRNDEVVYVQDLYVPPNKRRLIVTS
jgi:GntR family transcriptional regulator